MNTTTTLMMALVMCAGAAHAAAEGPSISVTNSQKGSTRRVEIVMERKSNQTPGSTTPQGSTPRSPDMQRGTPQNPNTPREQTTPPGGSTNPQGTTPQRKAPRQRPQGN